MGAIGPITRLQVLIVLAMLVIAGVYAAVRFRWSQQVIIWITTGIAGFAGLIFLGWLPPEEIAHLVNFGLLGVALGGLPTVPGLAVLCAVGLGDELLQGVLSYRVGHWRDVVLNLVSGGLFFWATRNLRLGHPMVAVESNDQSKG